MATLQAFNEELGEKVRQARLQKRMSQEQLALASELNTNSIGMIERGKKCPTAFTLKRICNSLDISLVQLFSERQEGSNEAVIERIGEIVGGMSAQDAEKVLAIVEAAAQLGKE